MEVGDLTAAIIRLGQRVQGCKKRLPGCTSHIGRKRGFQMSDGLRAGGCFGHDAVHELRSE